MKVVPTALADVQVLEPRVFADERGHFFESYNERALEATPLAGLRFVQDNQSRSGPGVLRGLHYQVRRPQGKLVRVLAGEIFDVAVDLRRGSPTFRQWVGVVLSADNFRQLWVPAGFGHGFVVTSDSAEVLYKTTDYYSPADERCIAWNDPELAIAWPAVGREFVVSVKDAAGGGLGSAEVYD